MYAQKCSSKLKEKTGRKYVEMCAIPEDLASPSAQ
jgi:hypothetical protein